ncbi:MAG: hypothetical protein EBR01_10920 [Proteobacteria bacterium]|jgi:hypothetical protein|nr:hypothetical protein [Pseudomonadota bacterium]
MNVRRILRQWNNRLFYGSTRKRNNTRGLVSQELATVESWQRFLNGKTGIAYGKIGTTELQALEFCDRYIQPIWPKGVSWKRQAERLFFDSGLFPVEQRQFEEFIRIYRESLVTLDGVCLWQTDPYLAKYEKLLANSYCSMSDRIPLEVLTPFSLLPAIASQRWLVVSPFAQSMQRQVKHLHLIFEKSPWAAQLSKVHETCQFLRCPLFSYLEKSPYTSWSEGLIRLCKEIEKKDFEVAIVGAGAWSLPLLARIKQSGRKGIHLGGATQILFGIKGRRWDGYWGNHYNEHWIRPAPEETPAGFERKENGCYW